MHPLKTFIIDDTSSDEDEIPTFITPKKILPLEIRTCHEVGNKNEHCNIEQEDPQMWHELQLKFLNHVVMVWVNRGRGGDKKIFMPDSILKARARETAQILRTFILSPNKWVSDFKEKLKRQDARRDPAYVPGNKSLNIVDIVEEEWPHFHFDKKSSSDDSDVEEVPCKDVAIAEKIIEDEIEKEEINDYPIQTYDEAWDCLKLVEEYALCVRNLRAVGLIAQMEELLRNQKSL